MFPLAILASAQTWFAGCLYKFSWELEKQKISCDRLNLGVIGAHKCTEKGAGVQDKRVANDATWEKGARSLNANGNSGVVTRNNVMMQGTLRNIL